MKFNHKKLKRGFKKAMVGLRDAGKETSKFVNTYGPRFHHHVRSIGMGVQEAFETPRSRNSVSFKVRPTGRMRGLTIKRRRPLPKGWRRY